MTSLIHNHKHIRISYLLLAIIFFFMPLFSSHSLAVDSDDYAAAAEERKKEKVDTNEIPGWPQGPAIGAKSAVLLDADSGTILYGKNINDKLFPASTTKLLTCILVAENCTMDELVTVSQTAIDNRGRNGSNMALVAGEQLTVEELLHGVLINSANDACNALAEHISGSIDAFVEQMNVRAAELGCQNSHFVTTHGYHDENHYCSAMDLAIIGKEFFSHEELCRISLLLSYHIEAEDGHAHEEHYLGSHNKMLPGCSYYYEGLIGSKTGYTDMARQTLVSCAENNGLRLICVIMKEESPDQFADTNTLFSYGFNNFTSYKITENEDRLQIGHTDFFNSSADLFGSTKPILSVRDSSSVLLPNTASFSDTETVFSYDHTENDVVAQISYLYHGASVGKGEVIYTGTSTDTIPFSNEIPEEEKRDTSPVIINVKTVLFVLAITIIVIVVVFLILSRIRRIITDPKRAKNIEKRRSGKRSPNRNHYTSASPVAKRNPADHKTSRRAKPSSPEEIKAQKEKELLAARKAAQAEIKSRQKEVQVISRKQITEELQRMEINTYALKDADMTTGYAKNPLPNVPKKRTVSQESYRPTYTSQMVQRQNPTPPPQQQKRPPSQPRRTSYSDMYRVGIQKEDS